MLRGATDGWMDGWANEKNKIKYSKRGKQGS